MAAEGEEQREDGGAAQGREQVLERLLGARVEHVVAEGVGHGDEGQRQHRDARRVIVGAAGDPADPVVALQIVGEVGIALVGVEAQGLVVEERLGDHQGDRRVGVHRFHRLEVGEGEDRQGTGDHQEWVGGSFSAGDR